MAYEDSQAAINNILGEINAINSKVQVIAQRMKIIERNEEIIGKTLIGHNKMLKAMEEEISSIKSNGVSGEAATSVSSDSLDKIREITRDCKKQVDQNKKDIDLIKSELNEIKYVLDAINPVAYVTVDQVGDFVEDKIDEYLKKKKG
jgi:chromosome segregation ATPase